MNSTPSHPSLYWLSFATDTSLLGVAIVEATDAKGAVEEANRRRLNPGGQILIVPVPESWRLQLERNRKARLPQ